MVLGVEATMSMLLGALFPEINISGLSINMMFFLNPFHFGNGIA